MAIKFTDTQVRKVAKLLDKDYDDGLMGAARAAMAECHGQLIGRFKFVVVGQLRVSNGERLTADDPRAIKLCLDWYSTEGDARTAAESLTSFIASGDEWQVWVLNVHHGSAATLHKKQQDKYTALEAKQRDGAQERLVKSIEKRDTQAQQRAEEVRTKCRCGHTAINHHGNLGNWTRCARYGCTCEKFQPKG